jgi:type I site-specific restriction endonuclease
LNTLSTLSFPNYSFRLRNEGSIVEIFDEIRKKWIALTPEEWVRQHLVKFLVEDRKFPAALISIERLVKVNGLPQRTDVVVYDRNGRSLVVCECKAPEIPINQSVFDQAARYNASIRAPYLLISNGMGHYFCKIDHMESAFVFLKEIPTFSDLDNDTVV